MPQSKKKTTPAQPAKETVPPVTIPKPVPPSGDVLLAREYPYLGDSIPGLLKAILKEMLLMRYRYERG